MKKVGVKGDKDLKDINDLKAFKVLGPFRYSL